MLGRLKEWIIRAAALLIPTLALAGVYAVLVKTYYLDSEEHRRLLLANAPMQSYFEHLRRKWGYHPEREIASIPGEVVKGHRVTPVHHNTQTRSESPSASMPAVGKFTLVRSPELSFAQQLASASRACMGLGEFEMLSSDDEIAPQIQLQSDQRAQLITLFETAKRGLLGWLFSHRDKLKPEVFELMRDRIASTGMKLPPVDFEPDLELRSIVVWSRDPEGAPTIAVGSKFLKLLARDLGRAQFEMTRAMAQGWAPCELSAQPWTALLECLGIAEQASCTPGEFSESGWAVSSMLASYVSFPQCRVVAFESKEAVHCLNTLALAPVAKDQRIPDELWKVGE